MAAEKEDTHCCTLLEFSKFQLPVIQILIQLPVGVANSNHI